MGPVALPMLIRIRFFVCQPAVPVFSEGFCFLHFFTTFFGETPTLEFEEEAGRYSSRVDNKSI